jgi:hypothetical protein
MRCSLVWIETEKDDASEDDVSGEYKGHRIMLLDYYLRMIEDGPDRTRAD